MFAIITARAFAATYAVKQDGTGDFTTIQACANVASAGDTCTVYAGTYNETPTLSHSGSAGGGNITFTVNSGDTVYVYGFVVSVSYVTINGFYITDPSLSHTSYGIDIPSSQNHITISNNTITQVGSSGPCINSHGSYPLSYVTITGNTVSWCEATIGGSNPHAATGIEVSGDHWLIKNNHISHTTNGISGTEDHCIIVGNTYGPTNDAVDFPNCIEGQGCDTHIDFFEVNVSASSNGYLVIEGNNENNQLGVGGAHMYIVSNTNGGTNAIDRFNTQYWVGSAYLGNNGGGSGTHMANWKSYNNTMLYDQVQATSSGNVSVWINAPYGAFINNLLYNDVYPAGSKNGYYYVDSGSNTGFVAANNLAWDTSCSPETLSNCVNTPLSTATGTIYADPKLVATDGSSFALQPGSPALNAGTYLTTVASTDSGSGTSLIVNDAGFFQDGYGIPGVNADCIAVTNVANDVCITAVNYQTNTLTLSSSITRSAGDPVWLYSDSTGGTVLSGSAPDIGASPISSPAPPPPPPAPPPSGSGTSLLSPRAYPNPWRSDRGYAQQITFDQLTGNTTIKIFTVSGHLVRSLSTSNTSTIWDLNNDSGDRVASGVYIYLATDDQGQTARGKVVVIR